MVFDRGDGGPWHPDYVSQAWGRLVARKGLPPLRLHDLRHAHACLMLARNVHPKVVSARLGHSNIAITMDTYSAVIPALQAEAAQVLDGILGVGR